MADHDNDKFISDENGSTIETSATNGSATAELNHHPEADADIDDEISYEERAQFAGVEPDDDDELVTTDELIDGPNTAKERGIENSPYPRVAIVAVGLGAIALVIWLFSGFFTGGGEQQTAEEQQDVLPEETTSPFGEDDALRAELALIEQERSQPQRTAETPRQPNQGTGESEADSEPSPPTTSTTRVSPSPPRPTPPPPRPTPPPPSPAPVSNRIPSLPPPTMQEEVDPLEQWARLATAGSAGADVALIPEPEIEAQSVSTPARSTQPVAGQPPQAAAQRPSQTEQFPFPSATIGDNPVPLPGEESQQQRRSPRVQSRQFPSITTTPAQPKATGRRPNRSATLVASSPGAQGILNQRPVEQPQPEPNAPDPNRIRQVAIGSSTDGEVVVPVIYAGGEVTSRGRFAVELSEPLMDIDGNVALEEGTVLITQIAEILDANILRQQVVAVVYRDSEGQVRQEAIEPGTLIIRGEDNRPLIAQVENEDDGGGFGQDLLFGALSAIGNIGSVINAPDSVTTATSGTSGESSSSSTSTTVTSGDDDDVVAAALDGFFTPVSERVSERLDESNDDGTTPYLFVPEGQTVSVFVNGLLEVVR